jgi:uncharacterized protein YkwD
MTTLVFGIGVLLANLSSEAIPLVGPPLQVQMQFVPADAVLDPAERPQDANVLLRDLNAIRSAQGLTPLAMDATLCRIARQHALDMAEKNYFNHDSQDGETPFDRMNRAGYRFGYAGENMARDQDPVSAGRALYASPGHRDNMLGPHYRRVGIAAVESSLGEIFVEDFTD